MIPDVRSAWRQNWLGSLQELADFDIQKRAWLNPTNANPHYSYVEYVASYFDDLQLAARDGYASAVEEGLLTPAEASAVADFHARFDAYVDLGHSDPKVILADPQWLGVVEAARSAQAGLLVLLEDGAEKALLTPRSSHAISAAS